MSDVIQIGDRIILYDDRMVVLGFNGEPILEVQSDRIIMNNKKEYKLRVTPHAKWEPSNVSSRQVRCSHCKGSVHFWHGKREWDWKFCKDCGAVMDLEDL